MKKTAKRKKLSKKRVIALLYHDVASDVKDGYYSKEHETADEQTAEIISYIAKVLHRSRFATKVIKIGTNNVSAMKNMKVDYIFNLVDSKAMEMSVARILDRLTIPHSGSSFSALQTSSNKIKTKLLLEKQGLSVPKYSVIHLTDRITRKKIPGKFPVIIKPAFEHCSIGITVKSIATNFEQFKHIVSKLRKEFKQTLICEQFIKGEELHITVLEQNGKTIALEPAILELGKKAKNKWNLYGFDQKWDKEKGLMDDSNFVSPPSSVSEDSLESMRKDAIRAFYLMGFKDYARFDLRYDRKQNTWYFLEGNANPGIAPMAGDATAESLKASGLTMEKFILQIVKNSLH